MLRQIGKSSSISAIMVRPSASPPEGEAPSCAIVPSPMLTQSPCTGRAGETARSPHRRTARDSQPPPADAPLFSTKLLQNFIGAAATTLGSRRRSPKGFDNNVQPLPAPGMLLGPFPSARADAAAKLPIVHQPLDRTAQPGNITHIHQQDIIAIDDIRPAGVTIILRSRHDGRLSHRHHLAHPPLPGADRIVFSRNNTAA